MSFPGPPDGNRAGNPSEYDFLSRLTKMRSTTELTGPLVSSYAYDAASGGKIGNMTSKSEGDSLTFAYDPAHIHAVKSTSSGDLFTYDQNGNIASHFGNETYQFDATNRMRQTASYPAQTDYTYDAGGNMVRRATTTPEYGNAADDRTIYVGGIYELHCQYGAAPTKTKYYSALGRTIAESVTPPGGSASVSYFLADHLGSTAGTIDGSGNAHSVKYYPFGKTRSGSVGTDKMYTGQQSEASSSLGTYFYHARFYSTVLGHFLSADSLAADGLNRYSYVAYRPVAATDPSGLDAVFICGVSNTCETGNVDGFKQWIIEYWSQHEGIFAEYGLDNAFALLEFVLAGGWSAERTLSAFHVGFIDTASGDGNPFNAIVTAVTSLFVGVSAYENRFWQLRNAAPRAIDTLMGYSMGGAVVANILDHSASHGYAPEAAILIQPGIRYYRTGLSAKDAPSTRILTVNDPRSAVQGDIEGTFNVQSLCSGVIHHCSSQEVAAFTVWAAYQGLNASGDDYIRKAAGMNDLTVDFSPFGPVAAPLNGHP